MNPNLLTMSPMSIIAWFIRTYEFSGAAILFGCLAILCAIGSIEAAFLMLAFAFGLAVAAMREHLETRREDEAAEEGFPALVDEIAALVRVREVTQDLREAA